MNPGKRLKDIRLSMSMTQEQLGQRLGLTAYQIRDIESGKVELSSQMSKHLRHEFYINEDWLLEGKGWAAISFSTSYQAKDWILGQLDSDVNRVLILTYEDGKFGFANGFVLDKKRGLITIDGSATRSGYLGGGPNAYRAILKELDARNIPTYQVSLSREEKLDLEKMDIPSLFNHPKIISNVIDAEFKKVAYSEEKYAKEDNVTRKIEFIYEDMILQAPYPSWTPDQVKRYFSDTYPGLTQTEIEGPEITSTSIIYRFVKKEVAKEALISDEFISIPMISSKSRIGSGLIPDNTIGIRIAFRMDWIQRHGDPHNMSLIRVNGDSMEPTFYSGDIVLVDHSRDHLETGGGIYAISFGDEIMIKRLQPTYHSIKIIPDNSKYSVIELESEAIEDLKVYGKVIWFGREIES